MQDVVHGGFQYVLGDNCAATGISGATTCHTDAGPLDSIVVFAR